MSNDRRERKSKTALKNALIELMVKKDADKITVSEICLLADVNRSTFYTHFSSVEQLLCDIHEDLFADMDRVLEIGEAHSSLPPRQINRQMFTDVLNYMRGDRFRFFLANNPSHLFERNLSRYYMEKYSTGSASLEYCYSLFYHTIGCFSLIQQWIADDCPCSSDRLAQLLVQLSSSGEFCQSEYPTRS